MRRIVVVFGISFILLAACTVYYTQPGKTTADFDRDKRYCEKIAQARYHDDYARMCDEIDRCLVNTKGWKRD